MDIFDEIILFPHIRLTPEEAAVLPALCKLAAMLVPDGQIDGLPEVVKPYTLGAAAGKKVLQSYRQLKKFGDEVLAQNTEPGANVAAAPQRAPLYDRETPLHILSDFREAGQPEAPATELGQQILAAAVTLLLCEDVRQLQNEAQQALAGTTATSCAMWHELKGAPDPLASGETVPPPAFDDDLMKKRLTAWSILARMLLTTNANVWLTFENSVLNLCLTEFEPQWPVKEIMLEKAKATFYQLPVAQAEFMAWQANTDADCPIDSNEATILGFVELSN